MPITGEVHAHHRGRGHAGQCGGLALDVGVVGGDDDPAFPPQDPFDRPGADPVADSIGYRQGTLWLNPDELAEMIAELRAMLVSRAGNEPEPGRRPHLISPIFFPIEEPPQ